MLDSVNRGIFEVRYPLPAGSTEDKPGVLGQQADRVTVKFQAHPGNMAGGVFGLRVMATD